MNGLSTGAKKTSAVKAMNTAAIAEATGMSWAQWCKTLDAAEGKSLSHNEIVRAARRVKPITGWWAQGVAVAYEQHIGRRKPGQVSDGTYSASASRTVVGATGDVFEKWCTFASSRHECAGTNFADEASTSHTPKRSYWRRNCEDGSKAVISVEGKANGRTLVVVEHQKLKSESKLAKTKAAWVKTIAACFDE